MARYRAVVQYNIVSEDGCAGVNPQVGLRPSVKFYGTTIIWDSHGVNKLTVKHLLARLDLTRMVPATPHGQHMYGHHGVPPHFHTFGLCATHLVKAISFGPPEEVSEAVG